MDSKKNLNRRSTRHSKLAEESFWDCTVCTYQNSPEAFKCLICDVRKGTSTRKPRLNSHLVAHSQHYTLPKVKKESGKSEKKVSQLASKITRKVRPKLKNVDRSSAQHRAVTVNNVTVIITEFQPIRRPSVENTNSCGTDNGNQSDSTSTSYNRACDSHYDSHS